MEKTIYYFIVIKLFWVCVIIRKIRFDIMSILNVTYCFVFKISHKKYSAWANKNLKTDIQWIEDLSVSFSNFFHVNMEIKIKRI